MPPGLSILTSTASALLSSSDLIRSSVRRSPEMNPEMVMRAIWAEETRAGRAPAPGQAGDDRDGDDGQHGQEPPERSACASSCGGRRADRHRMTW